MKIILTRDDLALLVEHRLVNIYIDEELPEADQVQEKVVPVSPRKSNLTSKKKRRARPAAPRTRRKVVAPAPVPLKRGGGWGPEALARSAERMQRRREKREELKRTRGFKRKLDNVPSMSKKKRDDAYMAKARAELEDHAEVDEE